MAQLGPLITLVFIVVPLLAFWAWMANDMLQSDQFPAWYYNLAAHPKVELQIRNRRFQATAVVAPPKERARLWEKLKIDGPQYQHHQALTSRELPVIVLHPDRAAA